MPAYNEEGCIEKVVAGWLAALRQRFGENFACVVVNDGSRDRTGALLDGLAATDARLRVVHQPNSGHGGALLRAYREALGLAPEYVFHVDSDDQFEVGDFDLLWARRKESAFILGKRVDRRDALHRLVITRILRWVLLAVFGVRVKDANIPFRLMTSDFLRAALARIPGDVFAPNIFLAVFAEHQGIDPLHVPVRHLERKTGKVSIVRWKLIKVCGRCVVELWRFRRELNHDCAKKPATLPA